MDLEELSKENEKLMAKRREVQTTLPPPLGQGKPLKWLGDLEKSVPPSEIHSSDWPPPWLEPERLGGNLEMWEAFNWDRHPKLRKAKRVIVDWYNDLPGSGALVLAGDVGCGKTHLADAIAELYGRWQITYYSEVEMVKKIQATYSEVGVSEEQITRALFRQKLVILDDLGTYRSNNVSWLLNFYNLLFNDYLTVRAKPLLITTNLPMMGEEGGIQDRIGPRSFSRLCAGLGDMSRYIDFFGIPDYRIEKFLK